LKILIVRLSAIGDIVMASPLIRALREHYPAAHIAWLAQPEAVPLLAANPRLNEVIVWPRGEWQRLWREKHYWQLARVMFTFRRDLRARGFDLVLDIQGLMKSGLLAWMTGAPQRIGLGSREGSARLMTRVVDKPQGDRRIGSEYRCMAEALGLNPGSFEMEVALSAEDETFVASLIAECGLQDGYAVICPFTTRPQKHWVETRWPELVARLQNDLGLAVVMLGGPGDAEAAARIAADAPTLHSLVGHTGLAQAAAVISRARLLVGVDTGLTHMGIAFAVPTLAIFGSTCPYLDTGRDNTRILYKALDCSPCRRRPTCDGAFTCMREINVDEVLGTARELLE
jgi:heptosyltransferase-1